MTRTMSSPAEIRVRPALPTDAATILAMVRELAVFEREPLASVEADEDDFLRDCFAPSPRCEVLIGEVEGAPQGFVLFFHNYSTWLGRAGIYVEDLYVRDAARGLGLGRKLLAEVARLAVERRCKRLELSVLDWNPARRFYEQLGFVEKIDWRGYRLTGEAIARLAEG
jgi:GNAT superfamily N-acetyltransferase